VLLTTASAVLMAAADGLVVAVVTVSALEQK
jgi:hypothetical protein